MRTLVALAVPVALVALGACGTDGSDGSDGSGASDRAPVADVPSSSTSSPSSSPSSSPTEPVDLGDADLVELTGEQICAALPVATASLAVGTEVAQAEPADSETPQCTYTYGAESATLSTFTVAAQRPDDVGGRGLAEAFDYVVGLNRGLASDTGLEEADVDAGDRAVRLTGDTLTLTVVATGGHLLTIITTPDLDTTAVEALAGAAADALS